MENINFVDAIESEAINGMVRVRISNELFPSLIGFNKISNPKLLSYERMGDAGSEGGRIFTVEGVKVYSHLYRDEYGRGRNMFLMSEEDAKAHLNPSPAPRTTGVKAAFKFADFATPTVATA